jgi:alpha-glucosidase
MVLKLYEIFIQIIPGLLPITFTANAQKKINLQSPNGNILFSFRMIEKKPLYSISFKGKTLVEESGLTLKIENENFEQEMMLGKPVFRNGLENYELFVGKAKQVTSRYREVVLPISESRTRSRRINIVVRAFDDGLAFRYEYPQQEGWTSYRLLDENSNFHIAGDPLVHTLFLPNYKTSHEGEYTHVRWSALTNDSLMAIPALFEFPDNVFMAITEAALLDYAGMYLMRKGNQLVSSYLHYQVKLQLR